MRIKQILYTTVTIAICLLLTSCSGLLPTAVSTTPPAETPTAQPTEAPTPTPSPTQAPTATPALTPTPTPEPTATPDPWAAHFTSDGKAWVSVADWDKGPWIYKDGTLSIKIELKKLGRLPYFRAEIYTRGPLPFGGFAYNDTAKARKRALPYLVARQNDAVFGITGDQMIIGDNPKGVMIRQGKTYKDAKKAPTMAVMPDGELKVFDAGKITAKELQDMGVKDSFAFGPILVRDGKVDQSVYKHRLKQHNWRASIGMVEKCHYIVIVDHVGIDLEDLAKLYVENNCSVAYNLDGGHSSTIVFMGEQLYKQAPGDDNGEQRTLSDMLLIGTNSAVPDPSAPVYCNGLGYSKQNKPKPTDGPLE